jgi:hypothetical protein
MIPGAVHAGVISVAPPVALADPVQVQRKRANFTGTGEITLDSAPTVGNLLILFGYGDYVAPAGWTTLAGTDVDGSEWILCAKESEGDETTVTLTGCSRIEYQEWSGMAALGSVYDSGESITLQSSGTGFDPAAVTADQDRAVYLALLGMSSSSTVDTDWTGCDATYNTPLLVGGHKIVTDGAAFDTAITFVDSEFYRGGVFVLRGES